MPQSAQDPPYELFYWPGIPGRGELIRLLFEEAGIAYQDHAKDPDSIPKMFSLIGDNNPHNPPPLAPPILKHGDLILSQSSNILQYLAPRLGLASDDDDDEIGMLQLNQIVLTIMDGLLVEVHDTHHPIASSLTYSDQKEESIRKAKYFTQERIPKYLNYIQKILDGKSSGTGPWLHKGKMTYADLVFFQCLDGTLYAFPKTMAKMKSSGDYNGVFKLYNAVRERPNIKAYLNSKRRIPYADGIWRCYPELDRGGEEEEEEEEEEGEEEAEEEEDEYEEEEVEEEEEEEEGSKRKKFKATK